MGVRVDFDDGQNKWVGSTGIGALASTTIYFSQLRPMIGLFGNLDVNNTWIKTLGAWTDHCAIASVAEMIKSQNPVMASPKTNPFYVAPHQKAKPDQPKVEEKPSSVESVTP